MAIRAVCTARCLSDQFRIPGLQGASPDVEHQARKNHVQNLELDLLTSLVGEGPAHVWQEWVAQADLPEPIEMLTKTWEPNPKRLDWTFSCLASMTQFIKTRSRQEQLTYGKAAWKNLSLCIQAGLMDLCAEPSIALLEAKLGGRFVDLPKDVLVACEDAMLELSKNGISDL